MLRTTDPTGIRQSVDQLEQRLLELEAMVSRIRAAQLEVLSELDRAQICSIDGARTLGEWVAGRLDLAPETGRSMAFAAISESQALAPELAAGQVSFDRVVATRRLANAGAGEDILSHAAGVGVAQIRRLTGRHTATAPADEMAVHESRRLHAQPNLDNTAWNLRGRLAAADGEHVFRALDEASDRIASADDGYRPTLPQRRADALVAWAMDELDPVGARSTGPAKSTRLAATIHIDGPAAARSAGRAGATTRHGVRVGPNTLTELMCIGQLHALTVDATRVMTVDVAARAIPPRIRDYVWHRDGGCTIAGCESTYRLEPHHIRERSRLGDHHPDNLTLLCWYHHHVVIHQRGFTLDPDSPPGRRRLLRPAPDRDPPFG